MVERILFLISIAGSLFLFQNCGSSGSNSAPSILASFSLGLMNRDFHLDRVHMSDGSERLFSRGAVSLRFTSLTEADGRLFCNNYSSSIELSETNLYFLETRTTLMDCDLSPEENFFFDGEYSYQFANNQLILQSLSSGKILYLVPKAL